MKIAIINAVYDFSSIGRTVKDINNQLKLEEHECCIYTACTSIPKDNVYAVETKLGMKVHGFLSHLTGLQGYFSISATKKLLKQLDNFKPDVVQLHNLHGNYINCLLLFKYLAEKDIPTVTIQHDCWMFTGHCCYYTNAQCDKFKTECHNCPILYEYNKSWFFDTSRRCHRMKKKLLLKIPHLVVVGNSDWTTQQVNDSFLKNAYRVRRIYNWIDLGIFYPRNSSTIRKKYGLKRSDFVMLAVCQFWSEAKGLSMLFDIAKAFSESKLVMVGGKSENLQIPANVIDIAETANVNELADLYSMADVYINTSMMDTFGKVSAEAISCGTPVVAVNSTAAPEITRGCGIVIEQNKLNLFVEAIRKIKKSGKVMYTEACVSKARLNFNKEINIQSYIGLYKDLLQKK